VLLNFAVFFVLGTFSFLQILFLSITAGERGEIFSAEQVWRKTVYCKHYYMYYVRKRGDMLIQLSHNSNFFLEPKFSIIYSFFLKIYNDFLETRTDIDALL